MCVLNKRKILFTSAKILVCFSLIYFIVTRFDMDKVIQNVKQLDIGLFILLLLIFLCSNILIFIRWFLIIKYMNIDLNTFVAGKSYLMGFFFNLFLPTSVGGDIFKAYYISKNSSESGIKSSLFSVFFDRYIGLIIMLFAGGAGACFIDINIGGIQLSSILFGIFMIILLINISIVLYAKKLDQFIETVVFLRKYVSNIFTKVSGVLNFIQKDKMLFVYIVLCSLCSLLMACTMHYMFILKVGKINAFLPILVFVPIVMISATIPISISGIGIREVAYITLFRMIGVDASVLIAMSVAFYIIMLAFALPGALCFVLDVRKQIFKKYES